MSKFCPNCGSEINEGADICTKCGKMVSGSANNVAAKVVDNPAKGKSIGALVCGIASVVFCWVPYVSFLSIGAGVTGIVLGVKGRKESPKGQTGMATAGLVLGIIGVCLSAIYSICYICTCGIASSAINDLNDINYWDY